MTCRHISIKDCHHSFRFCILFIFHLVCVLQKAFVTQLARTHTHMHTHTHTHTSLLVSFLQFVCAHTDTLNFKILHITNREDVGLFHYRNQILCVGEVHNMRSFLHYNQRTSLCLIMQSCKTMNSAWFTCDSNTSAKDPVLIFRPLAS